jgi:hypothetical protein
VKTPVFEELSSRHTKTHLWGFNVWFVGIRLVLERLACLSLASHASDEAGSVKSLEYFSFGLVAE